MQRIWSVKAPAERRRHIWLPLNGIYYFSYGKSHDVAQLNIPRFQESLHMPRPAHAKGSFTLAMNVNLVLGQNNMQQIIRTYKQTPNMILLPGCSPVCSQGRWWGSYFLRLQAYNCLLHDRRMHTRTKIRVQFRWGQISPTRRNNVTSPSSCPKASLASQQPGRWECCGSRVYLLAPCSLWTSPYSSTATEQPAQCFRHFEWKMGNHDPV